MVLSPVVAFEMVGVFAPQFTCGELFDSADCPADGHVGWDANEHMHVVAVARVDSMDCEP